MLLALTLCLLAIPSHAKWTNTGTGVGLSFYVDLERIRKHDGHVYFWFLMSYDKPQSDGNLSYKIYKKGDCAILRYKDLSIDAHKKKNGLGAPIPYTPPDEWVYPAPDSSIEYALQKVCNQ